MTHGTPEELAVIVILVLGLMMAVDLTRKRPED